MGIHIPGMIQAKHILQRSLSREKERLTADVPKGHFAVYVGETRRRFVVPISYLKHPLFLELLYEAEEEYMLDYGMGGIRIPCQEDMFLRITSKLRSSCC